jgi:hypothetical protein
VIRTRFQDVVLSDGLKKKLAQPDDDSKFMRMIKNRPAASLIPHANKRIIIQRFGSTAFAQLILLGLLGGIAFQEMKELHSMRLYDTRKKFQFKGDPYSGKVHCTYTEELYNVHGF